MLKASMMPWRMATLNLEQNHKRWDARREDAGSSLLPAWSPTCVAFPTLAALEAGYDVFVVTDASGTFNEAVRQAAWTRTANAGAQLLNWFAVVCELQGDWRNNIEGLGNLLANHLPAYRNLMTSYMARK
jgi:Isochorismatase family